jgi:hypothetical protein
MTQVWLVCMRKGILRSMSKQNRTIGFLIRALIRRICFMILLSPACFCINNALAQENAMLQQSTPTDTKQQIIGKWDYVDCRIKNTAVKGILSFTEDLVSFEGRVRQDYPSEARKVLAPYSIVDNRLIIDTDKIEVDYPRDKARLYKFIPMDEYFVLRNGQLYFFKSPDDIPEKKSGSVELEAPWIYHLKKLNGTP